jgi:site-specific DNA-cytosine methylase
LHSGTGSVLKAIITILDPNGNLYEVITIDWDPKFFPTLVADVRDWREVLGALDAKYIVPGYFDIIWSSPDCRKLSITNHSPTAEEIREALEVVQATLDCIEHLNPPSWFIENPQGRLRQQQMMKDLDCFYLTTTYCMYGTPYRKPTNFWTNVVGIELDYCCKNSRCKWLSQGRARHCRIAQNGGSNGRSNGVPRETAYQVPQELMRILMGGAITQACERRREDERAKARARRA